MTMQHQSPHAKAAAAVTTRHPNAAVVTTRQCQTGTTGSTYESRFPELSHCRAVAQVNYVKPIAEQVDSRGKAKRQAGRQAGRPRGCYDCIMNHQNASCIQTEAGLQVNIKQIQMPECNLICNECTFDSY